ncbi:MAG: DUF5684 domain-containing protein [Verrucomicrobiae bacterium]|jgi:hypothetical protein|nr:DUF5684 domain-containing protein [Verrucomicrobiae bacterium]
MHLPAPLLAQATTDNEGLAALWAGLGVAFFLAYFALVVLMVVARWKVNSKAGQPGWACLIPIYNLYVELRVAGMSPLWLLTLLACGIGYIVPWIICQIKTAQRFGHGAGFGLGLILLNVIFLPILAFGSSRYTPDHHGQA